MLMDKVARVLPHSGVLLHFQRQDFQHRFNRPVLQPVRFRQHPVYSPPIQTYSVPSYGFPGGCGGY